MEEAKKRDKYKEDQEFRKAIDDAFSKAEPAGARHARPAEREKESSLPRRHLVKSQALIIGSKEGGGPEDIIFDYFLVNQKGEQGVKQQGVMD